MASKYESYWRSILANLKQLLQEAAHKGKSGPLDVSSIKDYGERVSWHGVVDVSKNALGKGEMAHAMSLGNVILQDRLLDSCGDHIFRLIITPGLQLIVNRLGKGTGQPLKVDRKIEHSAGVQLGNQINGGDDREKRLLSILGRIPWPAWEQVCMEEPEWHNMLPFLNQSGYGPFAVMMLAAGLNDYQLRGRAEVAYWPPIRKLLSSAPPPLSPDGLTELLMPFYENERYNTVKIRRLKQFLSSRLAKMLWQRSPAQVSEIFPYIWRELAKTMNQAPQDKTISFAMKCLGLSLLMAGVSTFDFTRIPIPVDIRVVGFSQNIGLCTTDSPQTIRDIWNSILSMLQKKQPSLTMIHLDSLVWQIAAMNDTQMRRYFERIGARQAGIELSVLLQQKPMPATSKNSVQCHRSVQKDKAEKEIDKVVCFIPYCGSKRASGIIIKPERNLSQADLPHTFNELSAGRDGMGYCFDRASTRTSALYLYTGSPYEAFARYKDKITRLIQPGRLRLLIISAGYGILDALEPALHYDAEMKGEVATHWRKHRLTDVIADLLLQEKPTRVYGFFAGSGDWASVGAKYRYFFTEGVKKAMQNGLHTEAGCFYRMDGMGVKAILGGLGRTFAELMESGFDDNYVHGVYQNCRQDGNVKIGFEWINP